LKFHPTSEPSSGHLKQTEAQLPKQTSPTSTDKLYQHQLLVSKQQVSVNKPLKPVEYPFPVRSEESTPRPPAVKTNGFPEIYSPPEVRIAPVRASSNLNLSVQASSSTLKQASLITVLPPANRYGFLYAYRINSS
jgi:hypothetical protein